MKFEEENKNIDVDDFTFPNWENPLENIITPLKKYTYTVYCIQNKKNLKMYIGWSSNVKSRWRSEKYFAFNKNAQMYNWNDYESLLSKAFRAYATNSKDVEEFFTFTILEQFEDKEESLEAEIFWIEYFRTNVQRYGQDAGYNVLSGGQRGIFGFKATDEQKAIISFNTAGEKNPAAKLKKEEVDLIRNDYLTGGYTYKELGIKYNIGRTSIARIIKDKNWKDENYKIDNEVLLEISSNNKNDGSYFKTNNPKAKITFNDAENIRFEFLTGKMSKDDLALKYSLTGNTIWGILKNEIWIDENSTIDQKNIDDIAIKFNKRCKLNFEIANQLREDYKNMDTSKRGWGPILAKKYDIHNSEVHLIVNNKIWVRK